MQNMFADDERHGGGPQYGRGRSERGHGGRGGRQGRRGGRGDHEGFGPEDDFGPEGFDPRAEAMRNWSRGMRDMGGFAPGPFGRGGRGPGRGRRGDVRNAILALLAEEPMNGYQLINKIQEKSEGLWRPGPGSVYPALNLLADEGLIEDVDLDGKPAHQLSEAGKAYIGEHADEVNEPWRRVAEPHKGFLDVRMELGQLGMALTQVVQAGNPEQIEAAREVLTKARKDLYRILAED